MDQQHLFKYSKRYAWLKRYAKFAHSVYYSEICIINRESLPVNEPVIFAPNHQNALMDALAILLLIDQQPVFMARADIFKKKTVNDILTFLKIIPVFRIRDGIDNLSQNDESFNIALKALESGQSVGIMPEGNHGNQHRLRPLKKGIARFAIKAQESIGNKVPVKIVPVGIEYSHYSKFRSKLLVIFDKPIEVAEYMEVYKENPQKALNSLRKDLAEEIKKNMLNVDNSEYYDLIINIKDIYSNKLQEKQNLSGDYYGHFLAEKQVTDKLVNLANEAPTELTTLKSLITEYNSGLKKVKLRDWVFTSKLPGAKGQWFDVVRYLLFLPFFVAATTFNAIPYFISELVSKFTKDTQFRSSFKFVVGIILFPLYYLAVFAWPIPLIPKLLLIVSMPLLGVLSFDYFFSLKKLIAKYRYHNMVKKGNQELIKLQQLRGQIIDKLDEIFNC